VQGIGISLRLEKPFHGKSRLSYHKAQQEIGANTVTANTAFQGSYRNLTVVFQVFFQLERTKTLKQQQQQSLLRSKCIFQPPTTAEGTRNSLYNLKNPLFQQH